MIVQGPDLILNDGKDFPGLLEEAESAWRLQRHRALWAPVITELRARNRFPAAIFGLEPFALAALEEARSQGLPVIVFVDAHPESWGGNHAGLPVCTPAALPSYEVSVCLLGSAEHPQNQRAALASVTNDIGIASPAGSFVTWDHEKAHYPPIPCILFGLSRMTSTELHGYALAETPIHSASLWVDGQFVTEAEVAPEPNGGLGRLEFRAVHPSSGDLPSQACLLEARIQDEAGNQVRVIHPQQFGRPMDASSIADRQGPEEEFRVPFPLDVARALHQFDPVGFPRDSSWDEATLVQATLHIRDWAREAAPVGPGLRHVATMESLYSRFQHIHRQFPHLNLGSRGRLFDGDALCRATVPEEILAIAHHLLVLSSRGIRGKLLEFGCFKGLSTAMLSLACREAGLEMVVFDSFRGLPEGDSAG